MRLPRSRGGKTPIDVTTTEQNKLRRIRLSVGFDVYRKINSDLDETELTDLIVLLQYHLEKLKGNVPWDA